MIIEMMDLAVNTNQNLRRRKKGGGKGD